MASPVSICNLALSHLGDDATIASLDPPEGSPQAEHCQLWYPIARDTLLEMHPWKFATRRVAPALTAISYSNWAYVYREPSECIRVLGLLPAGATSDITDTIEYTIESDDNCNMILANTEVALVRYISRVVNTDRFTPLFVDALSWLVASYIAGPLLKGDVGAAAARAAYATFVGQFGKATGSNANQGKVRPPHTVPWIEARG